MANKKILITGASGMLGATLVEKWQKKFEVFATDKENFKENPAKNFMVFDLLNKSYDMLMDWSEPDVIIHCAAITNVDYCEENPEQAMAVNADSVRKFSQSDVNARLIFISSDAVFPDGLHLASEKDGTAPVNVYGKTKEAGEKYIWNSGKNHIAIRTTIVGKNINQSYHGFVEWIVQSVSSDKEITLFDDALFTPITIWHLADELVWIINNDLKGVIHIAGIEPVSKYDFGRKICAELGLDTALIHRGSIDDVDFQAKRSKDQSMDTKYYQRHFQRDLPTTNETVDMIVQHFKEFTYA